MAPVRPRSHVRVFAARMGFLNPHEAMDFGRYLRARVIGRSLPNAAASRLSGAVSPDYFRDWCAAGSVLPRLTVCIPTRDRLDLLLPCLHSLARTSARVPVEVIIADTGSRPQTVEFLRELGLTVVSVSGPFNFSRACNAAAGDGTAPTLLFLNDDTEALSDGWVKHLFQEPLGEVVGAALLYPATRRLQHAGVTAVDGSGWLRPNAYRPPRHLREQPKLAIENIGLGKRLEVAPAKANVMAVTGAFLATSRKHFEDLGGFDEQYELDLQDIDYCLRARARAIEVVCRRDIVFSHRHAGSRGRYEFPIEDWRLFVNRWQPELEKWRDAQDPEWY